MTTTFETAEVGDKVWDFNHGWGEIIDVSEGLSWPVKVKFDIEKTDTFKFNGARAITTQRTLFWDEIQYEIPTKPLPDLEVDTPIIVWDFPQDKRRRYFGHFTDGRVMCFLDGKTSWSANNGETQMWESWELPK